MANVGFVGLGIMGEGMCRNLLRKGHRVVVFNRTRSRMAPLVADGAAGAESLADLADRSDAIITILSDPDAVREVYGGKDGLACSPLSGKTLVDMSTVSPGSARETAAAVAAAGGEFLEAPVLGSRKPAADGTLTILTGGDATLSARLEPLLLCMGSKVIHMGPFGSAAHMKLIVNQMMGVQLCVFAEALRTGQAAGLAGERILEVVLGSAAASPAVALKGNDMVGAQAFDPHFPLKHAAKDMRLAVLAGDAAGVPTPVTAAAWQLFSAARAMGLGDRDLSAVLKGIPSR